MGRYTLAVAVFVVLLTAPCIGTAATITYSIQNYPADQNGATVSGTITTDGTVGDLVTSNILSWSWTITPSGGTPVTLTSSDAGSATTLAGSVIASPSEITLAADPAGGTNELGMVNTPATTDALQYFRYVGVNGYEGEADSVVLWNTSNASMGGTDPWVIAVASVPEPSTLTLAGFGVIGGLFYALARKRTARKTVASSLRPSGSVTEPLATP